MKSMKTLAAMATIAIVSLAGCGGSNEKPAASTAPTETTTSTTTTTPDAAPEVEGNVTLGLWDTSEVPKQVIAGFEKKYPKVKVQLQATPWGEYWTKLQTSASAGTAPDVFLMTPSNFPLYANNKQLMPIEEQGAPVTDLKAADYPEGISKAFEWEGKQYAYPKDIDTIAVFYNKKLYKEAGLTEPTSDWTWDQMVSDAKKMTAAGKGKTYGIAAALWDQGNTLPTVYAMGGETITDDMKTAKYDDPKTIAGTKMWVDLLKDGTSPSMKQMTDTSSNDWFKSGRIGIMWGGSFAAADYAAAPALKGNLGLVEMPLVNNTRVSMSNGLGPVVYTKTKNKAAAAALAAYISGPESQKIYAQAVIPSLTSVSDSWVEAQKATGLDVTPFIKAIDYARMMPRSKNSEAWGTPSYDVYVKMWDLKLPVEDGMKQVQQIVTDAIAKEK